MNNDNYLSIWNYIEPNLSDKIESEKVIVSMREDSNGEPFIEIIYINKNGEEISLTNGLNNIESIMDFASNFFGEFRGNYRSHISPIFYSLVTNKLHILIKENWLKLDKNSSICTCFIVNRLANYSRPTKIFMLAEVINNLMRNTFNYMDDVNSKKVWFYVNNEELENVYYKEQLGSYTTLNVDDKSANKNLEIINKQFRLNLTETPFQKVKR